MPLPDHRNSPRLARDALVLGPSAAVNRDPTATSGVNNTSQTVPQLSVPQQPSTSQPPRLVSRIGQLPEQGFSVEVAERIAAPQRSRGWSIGRHLIQCNPSEFSCFQYLRLGIDVLLTPCRQKYSFLHSTLQCQRGKTCFYNLNF